MLVEEAAIVTGAMSEELRHLSFWRRAVNARSPATVNMAQKVHTLIGRCPYHEAVRERRSVHVRTTGIPRFILRNGVA